MRLLVYIVGIYILHASFCSSSWLFMCVGHKTHHADFRFEILQANNTNTTLSACYPFKYIIFVYSIYPIKSPDVYEGLMRGTFARYFKYEIKMEKGERHHVTVKTPWSQLVWKYCSIGKRKHYISNCFIYVDTKRNI